MSESENSAKTAEPMFPYNTPPISKDQPGLPLSRAQKLLMEHADCDLNSANRILVKKFGESVGQAHYRYLVENNLGGPHYPEYGKVLPAAVPVKAFYSLLESIEPGNIGPALDAPDRKSKGGRPPEYDWESIKQVVAQMLSEDRIADTFYGFVENLLAELAAKGLGSPSHKALKSRLGEIHQVLKAGGKTNKVFKPNVPKSHLPAKSA